MMASSPSSLFVVILHVLLICESTFSLLQGVEQLDIPPVMNSTAGLIRGKYIRLSDGGRVIAYLGVPYALPPVGSLRFKPPETVPRWTDVYNATEFGPLCVQSKSRSHWDIIMAPDKKKRVLKRLGLFDYPQGEDCLNLNIYVPWPLPESRDGRGLSVMVYFHGGSYKTNGGRFYPGEWLANAGSVIVVTMNYRLGVLGFLSTQDDFAEGNYGLLDQVLALKWLRENLDDFGGNADDITIFGNSAGGSCVGLHLVSPMSRGLFSKAIAQSGSPLGQWALQKRPRMYAEQLAAKFNCQDTENSKAIMQCLKNISAYDIMERSEDAKTLEDSLTLQFAPVVDGKFLPKHPIHLLKDEGSIMSQVPVMVGLTKHELEVWMTKSYQERDPSTIPFTKDLLRKYLIHLLRKEDLSDATLDVLLHVVYTEYVYRYNIPPLHRSKTLLVTVLNNETAAVQNKYSLPDIRTLGKIISDIDLKAPATKFLELLAMHPNTSIYMYEFDYASTDDVISNVYGGSNNAWVGSYHESELYYLFGFPHFDLHNALRLPEDKQVSNMMVELWTNFAKYGNPTPGGDGTTSSSMWNFTWEAYTPEKEYFATLGLHPFISRSYEKERMLFWNHFVPLLLDFPITWSDAKSKPKTLSKLLEECHFEIILAFTFLGWATLILIMAILLHTCLCRTFKVCKLKRVPIPI